MRKIILLLALFNITVNCQVSKQNGTNLNGYDKDNKLIIVLPTDKKSCSMYSEDCKLDILVADSIDLKKEDVKSSDGFFMDIKRMYKKSCDSSNSSSLDCSVTNLTKTILNEKFNIYTIEIDPKVIGQTVINFMNDTVSSRFVITEPRRFIDKFFRVYVWMFNVFLSFMMGLLIQKEQLQSLIKKPIIPMIGFLIQYTIMPLLAFGFTKLFKFDPIESLALFLYGCCPGGSGSNNYTIIFDGDINLSAIMTFISNLGSLIMLPTWLYTLGSMLMDDAQIHIPFALLIVNMMIVVLPCLIGFTVSLYFPKLKGFALKIAKPFTLFVLITFLMLVFITKFYTFKLMKWEFFLAAPMIPWTGFFLGGFVAWMFKLEFTQIKTISIETGIQNVGIAFLIILTNFPSPESEYAQLPLVAVAFFTSIPLQIIYAIIKFYKYCIKEKSDEDNPTIPVIWYQKVNNDDYKFNNNFTMQVKH